MAEGKGNVYLDGDINAAASAVEPSAPTTEFFTPIKECSGNENINANILQAPTRPARVRAFQPYVSDSSDADTDSPCRKKQLSGPLMTSTPATSRNADDIVGDTDIGSTRLGLPPLPVKNLLSDFMSCADVSCIQEDLSETGGSNRYDDLLVSSAGEEMKAPDILNKTIRGEKEKQVDFESGHGSHCKSDSDQNLQFSENNMLSLLEKMGLLEGTKDSRSQEDTNSNGNVFKSNGGFKGGLSPGNHSADSGISDADGDDNSPMRGKGQGKTIKILSDQPGDTRGHALDDF